jgi:hypothetical protein
MKKTLIFALATLLSSVFGFIVNYSGKAQESQPSTQTLSLPDRGVPSSTPCPQENAFPKLIDDKHVTRFNGRRLNLDYDSGVVEEDIPFALEGAIVKPLPGGDLLVNVGDTLYRLNAEQHVVWRHHTAQLIFDFAYVESTNLIYGTAGDNVMFVLNAANGKVLTGESRNGSAAFGTVENYGEDMCLVTDNFEIYRERGRAAGIEPMKDGITCWRGTKILWHLEFPPDAELVVSGKSILAVTKSTKAIYINEIVPPPKTKS